jgi:hypothetical protein
LLQHFKEQLIHHFQEPMAFRRYRTTRFQQGSGTTLSPTLNPMKSVSRGRAHASTSRARRDDAPTWLPLRWRHGE